MSPNIQVCDICFIVRPSREIYKVMKKHQSEPMEKLKNCEVCLNCYNDIVENFNNCLDKIVKEREK